VPSKITNNKSFVRILLLLLSNIKRYASVEFIRTFRRSVKLTSTGIFDNLDSRKASKESALNGSKETDTNILFADVLEALPVNAISSKTEFPEIPEMP